MSPTAYSLSTIAIASPRGAGENRLCSRDVSSRQVAAAPSPRRCFASRARSSPDVGRSSEGVRCAPPRLLLARSQIATRRSAGGCRPRRLQGYAGVSFDELAVGFGAPGAAVVTADHDLRRHAAVSAVGSSPPGGLATFSHQPGDALAERCLPGGAGRKCRSDASHFMLLATCP